MHAQRGFSEDHSSSVSFPSYVLLDLRAVQPQMWELWKKLQGLRAAVKFLLNILRERIVVKQGAGGKSLERVTANIHSFRSAYAHICHALRMAAGDVDKLCFHPVERV